GHIIGNNAPYEKLATAGAADGAGLVIGIGSGTYHRAVAHSAPFFVGHPTGRSGSGKVSILVAGYCSNSAKFGIFFIAVVQLKGITVFNMLPLLIAKLIIKILRVFNTKTVFFSKTHRSLACQKNVFTF